MTTELPYRYDDETEDTLFVTPESIEMHKGNRVASMKAPADDDAVELAEAVLAAAELDCAVIDRGLLARSLRVAGESAALSMRERANTAARSAVVVDRPLSLTEQRTAIVAAIRTLPLLPEGDGQVDQVLTDATADRARADRLRTAWTSARRRAIRWKGTAEVRAAVRNRMKAQLDNALRERDEAREKATRMRRERDELRRALRSALSSPDEPGVHTTLSHMRHLADLPAEYMVDRVTILEGFLDLIHDMTRKPNGPTLAEQMRAIKARRVDASAGGAE